MRHLLLCCSVGCLSAVPVRIDALPAGSACVIHDADLGVEPSTFELDWVRTHVTWPDTPAGRYQHARECCELTWGRLVGWQSPREGMLAPLCRVGPGVKVAPLLMRERLDASRRVSDELDAQEGSP